MVTIEESDMVFGVYEDERVFCIEKSRIYKSVGKNVRTVEFILHRDKQGVMLIEAKTSAPNPNGTNNEDYKKFIQEITEKFTHTLQLYFAVLTKRQPDSQQEFHPHFQQINHEGIPVKLVLVIKNHEKGWETGIRNDLQKRLRILIKIWKLKVVVMNEDDAKKYGLIQLTA